MTNPRFIHDNPRMGSVRLSGAMYDDCVALARSKPEYRTFSRMVEILLWRELGCDPKYLKDSSISDQENE